MRPFSLSLLCASLVAAGAALAQAPPPTPTPTAASRLPWACTASTLASEQPCVLDGVAIVEPATKERSQENLREARVLAASLCQRVVVDVDEAMANDLTKRCAARFESAAKLCGGDGTRRLTDDQGRFSPGTGRCYAALQAAVVDATVFVDDARAASTPDAAKNPPPAARRP